MPDRVGEPPRQFVKTEEIAELLPTIEPDDQTALAEFWELFDAHRAEIDAVNMRVPSQVARFAAAVPPEQHAALLHRNRELQRTAMVDRDWRPWVSELSERAARYAAAGIPFGFWIS